MRILVTGGAGFIASHISDAYLSLGHEVSVVDNLTTGKRENLNPAVSFYELDVASPELDRVFAEEQPQVVCHHAAHIDVRRSVKDPAYDASVNIIGSLNLLESCRRHGCRKVIYAGTGGALFGEAEYLPVDEAHPINPISPYGVSKHTVEHYLFAYRETAGLDYTVLRYPNVYGPRQDPHGEAGVIAIFSLQFLRGEQPLIFGDGTKTRDYCFVDDIVKANVLALERGGGGLYNLGWGREVPDLAIFEMVRDAAGVECQPVFAAARPGEVSHVALDASLAHQELGWEPRVPLEEGIRLAVEFYRKQVEEE